MDILTVDFETYYSQTYSLSKLTTEEYLRSEEYQTIGVAVAVNDQPATWCSGPRKEVEAFLDSFNWAGSVALAHNAMFDMAILNWHYGIRPKRILDTLAMARALHGSEVGGSLKALTEYYRLGRKGDEVIRALGKRREDFSDDELAAYGAYCCNDVSLTYELFQRLGQGYPVSELQLIDLTTRMFTEPVLPLDTGTLQLHLQGVRQTKEALMEEISVDTSVLMSNQQFANALAACGVQPPTKISRTTGKETWAFSKTDEEFIALKEHPSLVVQALVAARLGLRSTMEETRTERLISIAERGLLPVPLRYYAAHTGRWGGDDKINMQNLGRGSTIKLAIRAPSGCFLLNADSSQIEARTLAWLAEQDDLVAAFERGDDVYVDMASRIYGKEPSKISKLERHIGKTVILGAGYGIGPAKLMGTLKTGAIPVVISYDEAKAIIDTYRATYSKIPALWRQADDAIIDMRDGFGGVLGREGVLSVEGFDGILLPNGLRLRYPGLRTERDPDTGYNEHLYDNRRGRSTVATKLYGGKLVENVTQALARVIIGEQMLKVSRKYRVAMTVHDSIVAVIPKDEAERAQEFVELCMRIRPSWALGLPLNCESGFGPSYGAC